MNCRTNEKSGRIKRLKADYRGAFGAWALQVSRLQEISGSADGHFVTREAEDRVAAAEVAYRKTRDLLTEGMSKKIAVCE